MSDARHGLDDVTIEDALDPGAAERREDEERARKRREQQRRAFLVSIMQNPEGRAWLKETWEKFLAFQSPVASVNGYAPDPMGTMLLLGRHKAGWELWEDFDAADPVLASRIRRGNPDERLS